MRPARLVFGLLAGVACPAVGASQQAPAPHRDPAPPGIDPGDAAGWAERPLENRWLAYRADLDGHAADKERQARWVAWLGERRDFALLEWIAVYEGWTQAGAELRRREAPQWMRAALWNLASSDSHDIGAARKTLVADAARVLGWVRRYPIARRGDDVEAFLAELERSAVPADPGEQLPPLDDAAVLLSYFDAPRELPVLGPDGRVEPGKRYLHQVVRALRGAHTRSAFIAPQVAKIANLLLHPHATVRAEAASALTRLPGNLVPHERLLPLTAPPHDPVLRRLATLASSFSAHPAAFFALHDIAADAAHPGSAAAKQRLAEIGDAITVAWMQERGVEVPGLAAAVAARAQADAANQQTWLQTTFERAAWAAATGHALAAPAGHGLAEAARTCAPRTLAAVRALQVEVDERRWDPGDLRLQLRLEMVRLREALERELR